MAAVAYVVQHLAHDNGAAASRLLGVPAHSLHMWRKRRVRPRLAVLLGLSELLGCSVRALVEGSFAAGLADQNQTKSIEPITSSPRAPARPLDVVTLEAQIRQLVASSSTALTLRQVAKRVGYAPRALRAAVPAVCAEVVRDRRGASGRERHERRQRLEIAMQAKMAAFLREGIRPTQTLLCAELSGYSRDECRVVWRKLTTDEPERGRIGMARPFTLELRAPPVRRLPSRA